MFGPPDPVEGGCNAHLHLADDYGDNTCTCRCTLDEGHDGPHEERSRERDEDEEGAHNIVIQWQGNDAGEED